MGLFRRLLTLPLAPVEGVVWLTERIAEMVDPEMHDPAALQKALHEAEQAYEAGEIGEQEFESIQEAIFNRLLEERGPVEVIGE